MKIKKNDKVVVIAGKDKGTTGTVLKAFPKFGQVLVSDVNVVKKHQRPRKGGEKGQVVEKAMPIDVSNVMVIDADSKKPTRLGYKIVGEKYVRISKKSGKEI